MDLSEVTNLLPAVAQALVRTIGITQTIRLVERLGGSTFPVPLRKNAAGEVRYQVLAEAVGEDAATQLVSALGGIEVYIPLCSAALREIRDREMRTEFDSMTGKERQYSALNAVAELAVRYRISDRQVWRILNQTDRDGPQSKTQATLF
ncbi:Mor transcription activator domain-containing protein [Cupriavidus sp. H19C3]|uniref:Mor transcription activator family protein n=1 Tax=Cupriavidus sp. H19C3 TaxID=3241603 RepID=UPI003BF8CCB8